MLSAEIFTQHAKSCIDLATGMCNYYFCNPSRKHAYIILTPLKPHCYIVKLGFTGVYIIFLISAQNTDCGYSLEPPRRGGSNEYPQSCFKQKYEKYKTFYLKTFRFLC